MDKNRNLYIILGVCPICGTILYEDDAEFGVIEGGYAPFFRWTAPCGKPVTPIAAHIFANRVTLRVGRASCLSHVGTPIWSAVGADTPKSHFYYVSPESGAVRDAGGGSDLWLECSDATAHISAPLEEAFDAMLKSTLLPVLAVSYLAHCGWYDANLAGGRSLVALDSVDDGADSDLKRVTHRKTPDGVATIITLGPRGRGGQG